MTVASTIAIKLDAQTAELKKGFADARKAVTNLDRNMSGSVAAGMAKFQGALMGVQAALGAVSGAINAVMGAMAGMDETQKFANRIGMSADALTALNFAAEQTGASARTMQMGLQRMTRRVSEAASGTGEAKDAIKELGLSAQALERMSPDQQFAAIADAMQGVENQSDKVRLAMKLFDSEGVALVNTLSGGSGALKGFADEASDLGLMLGDSREGIEAANDAINRMQKAWGALVQRVAIAVAPALEAIANALSDIVGWFNRLFGMEGGADVGKKMTEFGESAKRAAGAMKPLQEEVKKVSEQVKSDAERAQEIVERVKSQFRSRDVFEEKAIGAVTRSSQAGFSAAQGAAREQRNRERRHKAELAELRAIRRALQREGLTLAQVDL
jgi:uncharacterized protein Yka (UPF0111/DUF47 family)